MGIEISFDQLCRDHYDRLFTVAFRMRGNREDAEDVLQNALLQACRAWDSFRHESAPYTWLYRIVVNAARRQAQVWERMPIPARAAKEGVSEETLYAEVDRYGRSEDQALIAMVRESCLQMFMNCMPPRYRAVYTLRVMLGLSVAETAEILEIGPSTVKVDLHRARAIARDHLEGKCSLIRPGSMCDCRAFASYLHETGREMTLREMRGITRREERARSEFEAELESLPTPDDLYRGELSPGGRDAFLTELRRRREAGDLRILGGS